MLVKAIYREGILEPVEPLEGFAENQPVQLEIWPVLSEEEPVPPGEEEAARVQWIHENWASIPLSSQQALEIATADWILEENLGASGKAVTPVHRRTYR